MARIALFALLVITLDAFSQTDSTTSIEYDSTTTISLLSGETTISLKQLDTGFVIKLSDPRSKLLSFSLIYYFVNGGTEGLQQIPFYDEKASIEKKYPRPTLFKDSKSDFITLEHVSFTRNGRRYKARSLFLPIK